MTQIKKIDQHINRLKLKKNYLSSKINKASNQERRARTRTLIQLGGLIEKSSLMALVQIETGEDLQLDHNAFEKAATLFEILSDAYLKNEENSEKDFQKLKEDGIKKMKKISYKKKP